MPRTTTHRSSAKTISATTIWDRLREILGPSVNSGTSTTDVIGDDQAVRAFADVLNKSAQFKPDQLSLTPGDLGGDTTVGDIATAIITWYQNHGWQVTP